MAPLFEHYGIQLWTPEVGGRVDWRAEDHEETVLALGLSSKREITRTRVRVRTAMATQTREQGRYLGGRPPYGYRLGDAGPHQPGRPRPVRWPVKTGRVQLSRGCRLGEISKGLSG
jgi:site-specific DNA recombinase